MKSGGANRKRRRRGDPAGPAREVEIGNGGRIMKRIILIALVPFFLATVGEDRPGLPPGVPDNCCGYGNCRRASVEIIERSASADIVVVDGVRLTLPPGTAQRSKRDSSWWCYQEVLDGCEKEVSRRCARCAVAGGQAIGGMRVIPVRAQTTGRALNPATHLLLPAGGCPKCHAGSAPMRVAPVRVPKGSRP